MSFVVSSWGHTHNQVFFPSIMTLYYDPFDAQEEEDFLEYEQKRACMEIKNFVRRIQQQQQELSQNYITLEKQEFDFAMTKDQLRVILCALRQVQEIKRLEFCHWGLLSSVHNSYSYSHYHSQHPQYPNNTNHHIIPDDDGNLLFQEFLLTLMDVNIQHLGLTSCGITGSRLRLLWEYLTLDKTILSLNLSRNMLGGIFHQSSLVETFRHLTCNFTCLQELNLSATGLTEETITSLFLGLEHNHTLQVLDISNNFDSLKKMLERLLDHLPKLKTLRRLILTKGASSSTCIDSQSKTSIGLLQRFTQNSVRYNKSLYFLGPLFILPIDRQSNRQTQQTYDECVQCLDTIQFYLDRNKWFSILSSPNTKNANVNTTNTSNTTTTTLSILPMALERYNQNPSIIQFVLSETMGSRANC